MMNLMSTPINDLDLLELRLYELLIALLVRRPDGLSIIQKAIESVVIVGLEMGVIRDENANPKGLH